MQFHLVVYLENQGPWVASLCTQHHFLRYGHFYVTLGFELVRYIDAVRLELEFDLSGDFFLHEFHLFTDNADTYQVVGSLTDAGIQALFAILSEH